METCIFPVLSLRRKERSRENLAAVQDYATEHAYAMALVQLYRPVVLPRSCTGCYLTGSGAILPGGCTYE